MYIHIIHRQYETMELLISVLSANFYARFLLALFVLTGEICNIGDGTDERIFRGTVIFLINSVNV